MDLINNYLTSPYMIPDYFTKNECDLIIKVSKGLTESSGQAGEISRPNNLRKSKVRFITPSDETSWIFEKLQTAVFQSNQHYKFQLFGIREGLQVAEYKKGDHYTWHVDVGKGQASTRKLSISVQLTDGNEYEGGELEFHSLGENRMSKSIGSAIIFPSYLLHRVTAVTSGVRRSLVLWVHGSPFS